MHEPIELVSDKSRISLSDVMHVFAHAAWTRNRTRERVAVMLEGSSLTVLARRGGRPVAFARVLTDFAFRAFVEDVIVVSDSRRTGIGQALMLEVERLLRERRVERVDLISSQVGFWERLGYRPKSGSVYLCKRLSEPPWGPSPSDVRGGE